MTNPIVFPSNLSFLGLAKEGSSTYGTAVAAPTIWIPMTDPQHKPNQTQLEDQHLRGNMGEIQNIVAGVRYDTMSYKSGIYMDSIFTQMMAILGGTDVLTGASDPYTHKTSLLNTSPAQPNSWTAFIFNGADCWQMPGSIGSKLSVSIKADALAEISVEWTGLPATKIATPTNTPVTVKPWPAWNSTITVNSIASTQYSDITMSYERTTKAINTVDGTQAPYAIFAGPLKAPEIDFTGVYQGYTGSDIEKLLNNTQIPVVAKISPVGDATHYVQWQHTLCAATDSGIKSASGDYVEIGAKYKAIVNSTDSTTGGTGVSPVVFQHLTATSTAF